MAPGRTLEYAMWRCCERWGMRPPNVKSNFHENEQWVVALLLGFEQIRQTEEAELAIGGAFTKTVSRGR